MPVVLIDALSLRVIPRSHPEELNQISVIDRLNRLERKVENMNELLDKTVAENVAIKDSMEQRGQQSYAAALGRRGPKENSDGSADVPLASQPRNLVVKLPDTQEAVNIAQNADNTPPDTFKTSQVNGIHHCDDDRNRHKALDDWGNSYSREGESSRGRNWVRGVGVRGRGGRGASSVTSSLQPLWRPSSTMSLDKISNFSGRSNDGFREPNYIQRKHKRQEKRRQKTVTGTVSTTCGFAGAPEPSRDLFISRVQPSVTEDDVRAYLNSKGVSFNGLSCTSHAESKYKSFRLSVPASNEDDMLRDDIWPSGVRVRRYIVPRRRNFQDQSW